MDSVSNYSKLVLLQREKAKSKSKWKLANVECARSSDMGVNDTTFDCVTHLGNILHPGDTCLGYDLNITNFNPSDVKSLQVTTKHFVRVLWRCWKWK